MLISKNDCIRLYPIDGYQKITMVPKHPRPGGQPCSHCIHSSYFCIFCLLVCWIVPKDLVLSGGSSSILTCSALTEIWNMKEEWVMTGFHGLKLEQFTLIQTDTMNMFLSTLSPYNPRAQSNAQRQISLTISYVLFGKFSIYQQLYKD